MQMVRYRLQAVREFAELGLKFAIFVAPVDVLPAVVKDDMIISKVS